MIEWDCGNVILIKDYFDNGINCHLIQLFGIEVVMKK
jgi:hypothetical protein